MVLRLLYVSLSVSCFLCSYFSGTPSFIMFLFLFVTSFIEICFTCHTIYPFKMCGSVVFGILYYSFLKLVINHFNLYNSVAWLLCNNHPYVFPKFFITPDGNSVPTPLLQPLVTSCRLSASGTLTNLRPSYKWNHTECVLLCLPRFTLHNVFQGLASHLSMLLFFAFHLQVGKSMFSFDWLSLF